MFVAVGAIAVVDVAASCVQFPTSALMVTNTVIGIKATDGGR